jgi:hypothetical protein
MEHIRQAVERARASAGANSEQGPIMDPALPRQYPGLKTGGLNPHDTQSGVSELDPVYLESMRIIAHDVRDPRSKPFDILRTQVLRSMDQKNWQFLAITSPTPGCGKSLIAINLALSIARQPDRSVLLVDMDLQRPQLASNLGLQCNKGLLSVLEGRTTLSDSIIETRINKNQVLVLPCETSTTHSSEWMASREISGVLRDIRKEYKSRIVILDMPPVLPSDDVISILPQLDCLLLVATVGVSTVSDIEKCNRHLQSAEVVRVVLNKVSEPANQYYYY